MNRVYRTAKGTVVPMGDIPRNEIESYVEWLESNAEKRGVPLSEEARILKMAVGRYLLETTTTH